MADLTSSFTMLFGHICGDHKDTTRMAAYDAASHSKASAISLNSGRAEILILLHQGGLVAELACQQLRDNAG